MTSYLLITESPAKKAKKIQGFLGSNYKVLSSCGHIRDLEKRKQNNMVIQRVLVLMLKIILNLNML